MSARNQLTPLTRAIKIETRSPSYAALNPITDKIYITYENAGIIFIINTRTGDIEKRISADYPTDIIISSKLNKVYVTAARGVYEIDGSTNECNLMNKNLEISARSLGIQDCPSSLRNHLVAVHPITNKVYKSKNDNESISVHNTGDESNKLEGTISFKESKWNLFSSSFTNPSFVLINENLGVLYVKAVVTVSAGGGGGSSEQLLVVDLDTKKVINRRAVPSTNTQTGFALNRSDNTVFMRKYSQKAIVKYDGYLKRTLNTTVLDNTGFWKRIFANYSYFAEVIVVNSVSNKVYTTDSKLGLLYEIDG